MRQLFWDYMQNPSAKGLAQLTTMEQEYAEKLKGMDQWPDGQKKGKAPAPPKSK